MPSELELQFHKDMVAIYTRAKQECGYTATRFLQLTSQKGGLAAAKQLISNAGNSDGFWTLAQCGRLDLTVEAHVVKPEYADLFTAEEKENCRNALAECGYVCR